MAERLCQKDPRTVTKIILSAEELNMIQTLRNAQALTSGTQVTGNAGDNSNSNSSTSRRRKVQRVYKVISKGRHAFNVQLTKDGGTKRRCLEAALSQSTDYPDQLRFWPDFKAERDRLLDSKRFCADCKARNLVPSHVADHIVFEGKGTVNKVVSDGLQVLGEKVQMFNCPLWQDTENLFDKEGGNE